MVNLFLGLGLGLSMSTLIAAFPSGSPPHIEYVETNVTNVPILSAIDIHINVMATLPAHRITTSADLHEYLAVNREKLQQPGQNSIYVSDAREWVVVRSPPPDAPLEKRQSCTWAGTNTVVSHHPYWGPWHALTKCLVSQADPAGGSISYAEDNSIDVSYDGGFDLAPFQELMTTSFGYAVTFSYSVQVTGSCNTPTNGNAQVWGRDRMAWSSVTSTNCEYCNGATNCESPESGWINAISSKSNVGDHTFGCSAEPGSYLKGC